jgi:hypothetical protein
MTAMLTPEQLQALMKAALENPVEMFPHALLPPALTLVTRRDAVANANNDVFLINSDPTQMPVSWGSLRDCIEHRDLPFAQEYQAEVWSQWTEAMTTELQERGFALMDHTVSAMLNEEFHLRGSLKKIRDLMGTTTDEDAFQAIAVLAVEKGQLQAQVEMLQEQIEPTADEVEVEEDETDVWTGSVVVR